MFKTPKNIDSLSSEEILELIKDKDDKVIINKEKRLKLIKVIYTVLGFDLAPDLLFSLLAEPKAQLILATAGAGKTTSVQLKIILEKIVRQSKFSDKNIKGEKVLCLVYNKHNVSQIEQKHRELVSKLYARGVRGLEIDRDINAATMHSFCFTWAKNYAKDCGLLNIGPNNMLNDSGRETLISNYTNALAKKYNINYVEAQPRDILALYDYMKGSMAGLEALKNDKKFKDLNLPFEFVNDLFNVFEKKKISSRLFDFTDMLTKILDLLKNNEEARHYIQNYYEYIVADEIQDFTPLMMEILKLVKDDKTSLVCIGDEDQSIYNFLGADIYNTLDFSARFKDGEVYTLGTNRRCSHTILESAKKVIYHNTLRFDKQIKGIKSGGNIEYIPYATDDGQIINLINRLKKMTDVELSNTAICYRNKRSSLRLSEMLEKNRISFNILSGYSPFTHEIYRHVTNVLDILYMPYDREYLLNLYKCMPITKEQLYGLLEYNPKTKKWKHEREKKHFCDYDFGKFSQQQKFLKILELLRLISSIIQTEDMDKYIGTIFDLINTYYWKYKQSLNKEEELDSYFTTSAQNLFNVRMSYPEFYSTYLKRKELCRLNNFTRTGVTLSTFHKLKGLEFKNVYIIDLDEEIYPDFAGIESQKYSSDIECSIKECETRLFYVAITRAIDNLYLYYQEARPSIYLEWMKSSSCEVINSQPILDVEEVSLSNTTGLNIPATPIGIPQLNPKDIVRNLGIEENKTFITEPVNNNDTELDIDMELEDSSSNSSADIELDIDMEVEDSSSNTDIKSDIELDIDMELEDSSSNTNSILKDTSNHTREVATDIDKEDDIMIEKEESTEKHDTSNLNNRYLSSILGRL